MKRDSRDSSPDHPAPVFTVGVRLSRAEREALDREVRRIARENPAAAPSRSSVLRGLLARMRREATA